jgi:serine/threonine protein kinase
MLNSNSEKSKMEFLTKVDLSKINFEIRIADFGFSKCLKDLNVETMDTICGTPLYMSSQIVEGTQRYTYKTDIWSLGVLYYELLTGSMPFTAEKMTELARNMGKGLYVI